MAARNVRKPERTQSGENLDLGRGPWVMLGLFCYDFVCETGLFFPVYSHGSHPMRSTFDAGNPPRRYVHDLVNLQFPHQFVIEIGKVGHAGFGQAIGQAGTRGANVRVAGMSIALLGHWLATAHADTQFHTTLPFLLFTAATTARYYYY